MHAKINSTFINSADNLDIAMPMYKYSDNYSITSGSLRNYRDELNDDVIENNVGNFKINHNKATISKSFE